MAGDGASLDDEVRDRVKYLLDTLLARDLTASELREVKAIFDLVERCC